MPTTTEQYREKMNDIRLLLNLLRIEASRAEEYMLQAGADKDDVRALNKTIKPIARVYGVLAANEDLTTDEALRMAKDLADCESA